MNLRYNRSLPLCIVAATALLPTAAFAHPGHGEAAGGLFAGIWHPLTGADHLVAMVLVGIWAGLLAKGRAALTLPAAFLAAMIAGFATSALIGGSYAEPLILASLVVLGAAAAFKFRAPAPLAMAAVAVFGFAHGMAHGFETPGGAFPALFAAGFLASTAALHGLGLWLARVLPLPAMRLIGAGGAGLGLLLAGAG